MGDRRSYVREKRKGEEDRVVNSLGEKKKLNEKSEERREKKSAEESRRSCVPSTVKLNSVIDLSLLV